MLWTRCPGLCIVRIRKRWRWLVFPWIELSSLIHFVLIFRIRLITYKCRRRRPIHQLLMNLFDRWRLISRICRMISTVQHVHWRSTSRLIMLHGRGRRRWVSNKVPIRRPDKVTSYWSRIMNWRRWHRWRRRPSAV